MFGCLAFLFWKEQLWKRQLEKVRNDLSNALSIPFPPAATSLRKAIHMQPFKAISWTNTNYYIRNLQIFIFQFKCGTCYFDKR